MHLKKATIVFQSGGQSSRLIRQRTSWPSSWPRLFLAKKTLMRLWPSQNWSLPSGFMVWCWYSIKTVQILKPNTGFLGQGRAKLRVFRNAIARKITQLCPSLTRKPGIGCVAHKHTFILDSCWLHDSNSTLHVASKNVLSIHRSWSNVLLVPVPSPATEWSTGNGGKQSYSWVDGQTWLCMAVV